MRPLVVKLLEVLGHSGCFRKEQKQRQLFLLTHADEPLQQWVELYLLLELLDLGHLEQGLDIVVPALEMFMGF